MEFGKLDIILNVKSIEASHEFYQKLGFEVVSWEVEERVSVLQHKLLRLILMQGHVDGNMFNFRPEDISKLLPELKQRFPEGKVTQGGKAFDLRDPDGNKVYVCEDH